ncbi:MAG: hypothetical protein EOP01_07170 [Propionibacteriaceae bacterium]|nr:MAG: hypothetical protein EOP01_07170 [Propionibacteriaceae bacterium]
MSGQARPATADGGGLEAAGIFTAGVVRDVCEGWVTGVELRPNVARFNLEWLRRGIETAHPADILAVHHGDVGVSARVAEGMIHKFAEAGAAGQADQEEERGQSPHARESS